MAQQKAYAVLNEDRDIFINRDGFGGKLHADKEEAEKEADQDNLKVVTVLLS